MLSSSQMYELMDYRRREQEEKQQKLNEKLQDAMNQSSQVNILLSFFFCLSLSMSVCLCVCVCLSLSHISYS